jgi:hypothetical protein
MSRPRSGNRCRGEIGKAVKLDKLARQLRRDISASPKKAAALGLMLVVAIYFWAPMVWGWIKPGSGKAQASSAGDVILEDDPVDPVVQASKSKHVFAWEKVRKHVAADPRMTPALLDPDWRDPFHLLAGESASEQAIAAAALPPQAAEVDPAAAGLVLTSVAIGTRLRSATITGETYHEGEPVRPTDASGKPIGTLEFRLVKVELHSVELEHHGRTYKLELQRAKLAQGDEITSQRHD